MENREEYQGKMEAQLGEWGAKIDKLKARADKAAADTRQGYYDEVEALRVKQASMQVKLQELKTSGDGAWGDLKEGLDHSWNQVKKGISIAEAKAKDMVKITMLSNHIGQKQREIEQLYNKIGQAAFKAFQDNALSDIEAAIKDFSQEIVQKQQEIAELERDITEIRSTDAKAPEAQSPETKSDEDPNQIRA